MRFTEEMKSFFKKLEKVNKTASPDEEIVIIQLKYMTIVDNREDIMSLEVEQLKKLVSDVIKYDMYSDHRICIGEVI